MFDRSVGRSVCRLSGWLTKSTNATLISQRKASMRETSKEMVGDRNRLLGLFLERKMMIIMIMIMMIKIMMMIIMIKMIINNNKLK
jgi:hypothetical protein